jgi:hypothetical protein
MARIFLGIQIQCAQCHDHKTDRWTREQFHELTAFFPRVALRPVRDAAERTFVLVGDDRASRRPRPPDGRRGRPEHYMPDLSDPSARGTLMTPTFFLTGQHLALGTPDAVRRETLARWITESPWFAKAYVNRMWSELVGESLYVCGSVDDLGPDRTCKAPETMEYLSAQFVACGHDTGWLFQVIAATQAYQRQGRARHPVAEQPFAANCWQRLRADSLFNALASVLEFSETQQARRKQNNPRNARGRGPRAGFQLTFGYDPSEPRDEITGSIPQALTLMNAREIHRLLDANNSTTVLGRLLRDEPDDEAVCEELYLRALARLPSAEELDTCLDYVREIGSREEAFEDMLWALVNSTEFLHRR